MTTDSQRNLRPRLDLSSAAGSVPRLDGLGVIVLTAQSGESEEKALDLRARDCLAKPVQTRSLVARVRAVLKRINT